MSSEREIKAKVREIKTKAKEQRVSPPTRTKTKNVITAARKAISLQIALNGPRARARAREKGRGKVRRAQKAKARVKGPKADVPYVGSRIIGRMNAPTPRQRWW